MKKKVSEKKRRSASCSRLSSSLNWGIQDYKMHRQVTE